MMYLGSLLIAAAAFCAGTFSPEASYTWSNVTPAAGFPQGYNYPVFVMGDRMVAMNNGSWISKDGRDWSRTELPESGLNSGYQRYVLFNGAIYALGKLDGNYERFSISTRIMRTRDLRTWETVAESSNLPQRIFYGATVFANKIWLIGGYDGKRYYNDVWNSTDGVKWQRVAESAAWSPRNISVLAVFQDRLWVLGGGPIDGDKANWTNPNCEREVWSSADGITWARVAADLNRKWRGTPVVFDNKLWLVGANRGGTFDSDSWVTADGARWKELPAPWSPRGAVAAWVFDGKLFMTGGKSSHTENGELKFVYSNDVWAMSRKNE
jgi:hypothetical protein